MQVHFDSSRSRDCHDFSSYSALTNRLMYPAARSQSTPSLDGGPLRLASMDMAGLLLLQLTRPPGASARSLRHGRVDAMFVSVLDSGQVILDIGKQRIVQNTGDIIVWNADQPHEWRYPEGMSSTCVRLPRHWPCPAAPDNLGNRVLHGTSPRGGLIATMVRQIAGLPAPDSAQMALHLRCSLLHVLYASLADDPPRETGRLADARQSMRARLDDPELTPSQVARDLGMSLRSLARLFAAEGSTPSRWLWNERLNLARRLLEVDGTQRVTDVALACGFTSFSHFSRAFRKAHGMAPSALLNRAGGGWP